MGIQLQMAGTGSAFSKKYYNNNALIRISDFILMIDFGITAPLALHHMGVSLGSLDAVLVTHLHADHIGGLEELAFQMLYIHKKKVKLFIPTVMAGPLWENSLKAGMESPDEGLYGLEDFFDVIPLEENEIYPIHDGLSVEIFPTSHVSGKPNFSLIINGHLFYSGDCRFNGELLDRLIRQYPCDVILHDCQLEPPGIVHTSLDQLLTLPPDIQEKIYLMHYGDRMEEYIGKTGSMRFIEQHKIYQF
ncbi:MBL fold metallo-hydrolase [Ferviditalea candida]|uniref:MBL fold metallo-hydrolase n=1 Tax=Ferviditalea candida TaxID=3108399 RepID=A0ABU5ZKG2_9BACL|nr:MBL fold metallo-hydrolase [Paenibacillaceae bacterium T2]